MKRFLMLAAVLLSFVSGSAVAGGAFVISTGSGTLTETKGYAGLSWTLGGKKSSAVPDAVIGVRSVKVKADDHISNGADVSVRVSFKDGMAFDSFRLSYLAGKRELMGNFGIGYSVASNSLLGTLAAQGAYSRFGLDYLFTPGTVLPYLELLTTGAPKKATKSGLACSDRDYSLPPNPVVGDECDSDLD